MSLDDLEQFYIDTLVDLLLRSQQSRERKALCINISIDYKRLNFLENTSDRDFFIRLIHDIKETGNNNALCNICCKELFPIFGRGRYAAILRDIAAILHCNQELTQNFPNKQPIVQSPIPTSNIKNKLITGGTIFLIGLAGFILYNQNSNEPNNQLLTKLPVSQTPSIQKNDGSVIAGFNKKIQLRPNNADAYYSQGLAYAAKMDYDLAIADFTKALNLNPKYADAYYNRGLAYAGKQDYDLAITDYNLALNLNPKYADAYYNRGLAYAGKKDYDLAIADYNLALNFNPKGVDAYNPYYKPYYNKGLAYAGKKDYDLAIVSYNLALKLNSKDTDVYYNRGLAYKNKDIKNKAVEDFKEVLRLNDNVELSQNAKQQLQELGVK